MLSADLGQALGTVFYECHCFLSSWRTVEISFRRMVCPWAPGCYS